KDLKHKTDTQTRKHSTRAQLEENQKDLWEALRNCRSEIASEQKIPPFIVFHDATLMEMIAQQPRDKQQFSQISGVGQHKLDNYAQAFLDVINLFHNNELQNNTSQQSNDQLSDTVAETLFLFKSKNNVETIAQIRKLSTSTILDHISKAIKADAININNMLDELGLTEKDVNLIHHYWLEMDEQEAHPLKALYNLLDEKYSYPMIKIVTASFI
ncbi:MAG: HRDC domain-containing protein, partial [Pseudomonadota bacterium]